jgi:hypothetical protein
MRILRWEVVAGSLAALLAGVASFAAAVAGTGSTTVLSATADRGLTPLVGSKYTDVAGRVVTLGRGAGMAFVFLSTECPISNGLIPELNRLAGIAQKNHVEFYGVLSDPSVTRAAAQKYVKEYAITYSVLFDASGTLAAALQPAVTPQAFVLDARGRIQYSGRINDRYVAVGKPREVVTASDLQDAIAAVAAGKRPPVATTTAIGCVFESWKRPAADTKVTWSRDIAPIVYASCTPCHHDGEVAPFPLVTYNDAAKRAEMLAAVTGSKQMPPWKAANAPGTFHDERRLTDAQVALFRAWADAVAPEGDKADAPPPPTFTNTWQLGTPDLIVKMPKPFNVPASGRDLMTFTVVPLNVPQDETVIGFEYRPGNRRVVHHMIALLDASGAARKIAVDRGDGTTYTSFGGPGFLPTGGIGGWAPGATPRLLPDGVGKPLKKGSDLVLNIHYHPSGRPESDQGEVALYFAKNPVAQRALTIPLRNRDIDIPPGEKNYIRTASITAPIAVTVHGITPHMHNLGREMKVTATLPDGSRQVLIDVQDWDWNWQDQYQFATPIHLPRGTKVDLWARYDNSKDNPRNPQNPPKRVRFGEQTTDEMCLAFLELTIDGLARPAAARSGTSEGPVRAWIESLRQGR